MKDLPDIVPNPKAPHAAALVRLIAKTYGLHANVPAEITRIAKIADASQSGRWAKGTTRIGPANAKKLRAAFPRLRKEIDEAVRGDHAGKLEKAAEGVLDPVPGESQGSGRKYAGGAPSVFAALADRTAAALGDKGSDLSVVLEMVRKIAPHWTEAGPTAIRGLEAAMDIAKAHERLKTAQAEAARGKGAQA